MRRSISLRLDDELSDLGQQRLERHLNHCSTCAQFAAALAYLTNALRDSTHRGPSRSPTLT
jgi:predicted anti-sigma-YlaC factor YlaD